MNPVAVKEGLEIAIDAVELLHAIAVAGGNSLAATDRVSILLKQKHAKGETLTRDELHALMDQGDLGDADAIARVKAALQRQAAAAAGQGTLLP